jgi:hypothetical protein
MDNDRSSHHAFAAEFPRRLKLSAREIGVALALTFAAGVQLFSALSSRDGKSDASLAGIEPASLIRPAP